MAVAKNKPKKAAVRTAAQRSAAAKKAWQTKKKNQKENDQLQSDKAELKSLVEGVIEAKSEEKLAKIATTFEGIAQNITRVLAEGRADYSLASIQHEGPANRVIDAEAGGTQVAKSAPTPAFVTLLRDVHGSNSVYRGTLVRINNGLIRLGGTKGVEIPEQPGLSDELCMFSNLYEQFKYTTMLHDCAGSLAALLEADV